MRDNGPAPSCPPLGGHTCWPPAAPSLATSLLGKRAQQDKRGAWGSAQRVKAAPVAHTSLTDSSIREPRGHFSPPNPPLAAAIWLSSRRPRLHQLFSPFLPLAKRSKEKGPKICALEPLNFPTGKGPNLPGRNRGFQREESSHNTSRRPHERAQHPGPGPSKQLRALSLARASPATGSADHKQHILKRWLFLAGFSNSTSLA